MSTSSPYCSRALVAIMTALAGVSSGPGVHARAADAAPQSPAAGSAAQADQDSVTVETLTPDRRTVLSTNTYDGAGNETSGAGGAATKFRSFGSGGTASASGCQRATVVNVGHTLLGYTAFKYNTWTEWCWNRADHVVEDVRTGQFMSDVDPFFHYRQLVTKDERLYAWLSGYNKSGHWHERQALVENCIPKLGCPMASYPRNSFRAHSDGTFSWSTAG